MWQGLKPLYQLQTAYNAQQNENVYSFAVLIRMLLQVL